MYRLQDSLLTVNGVGPKLFESFEKAGIRTVKDLLLHLPFRYEDRSVRFTIDQIKQLANSPEKKLFTLQAWVKSSRSNFFRGRSMQSATLTDETGTISATWFNNPYIVKRLKSNESYLFSGQVGVSKKGQIFLTQPVVEDINKESIHTDRLVPVYSSIQGLQPTIVRKLQKEILDSVEEIQDQLLTDNSLSLSKALKTIHFPDEADAVIHARERFALEELVLLIQHSLQLKDQWKRSKKTIQLKDHLLTIPETIPFELTNSQKRSAQEIIDDLNESAPMNRLLIGDVGSGKTIVAGLAMQKIVESGHHAAIIAPTQILAEQHVKTLQKFFPSVPVYLFAGKSKAEIEQPGFIVGTHSILNIIKKINEASSKLSKEVISQLPAIGLIIFDEQHRFGVAQRSELEHLGIHPHLLTMTATPIPRSLMLTIFSHLNLSTIDELPKNRVPTKTWVLPEIKRESMYSWIKTEISRSRSLGSQFQVLVVCPFINPSESEALENVAAAKDMYETVKEKFATKQLTNQATNPQIAVSLLHSKLKKNEKAKIISDLFNGKIDVLVTTPIVEVGVDLPQASAIIIEASERFGFASLHQLRGRVGRAGQQGYCILFSNSKSQDSKKRLKKFEETHSGQELAELDLQNRGAGDLFGTQQHGFDNLQFASWTDLEQIRKAKDIIEKLQQSKQQYISPLLTITSSKPVLAN